MDLHSMIRCIPISTNRFTQKCDCVQNHKNIFLFLKHIMKQARMSGRMLIFDQIMSIFYEAKFFGQFWLCPPPPQKKNVFSRAPMWLTIDTFPRMFLKFF